MLSLEFVWNLASFSRISLFVQFLENGVRPDKKIVLLLLGFIFVYAKRVNGKKSKMLHMQVCWKYESKDCFPFFLQLSAKLLEQF